MRDINRIPRIIHKLESLWTALPDWRMWQLLVNIYDSKCEDPFFVEDEETEEMIDNAIKQYTKLQ